MPDLWIILIRAAHKALHIFTSFVINAWQVPIDFPPIVTDKYHRLKTDSNKETMRFDFYHSTCNAVLAPISLFAFGFRDVHSKTVQSADELLTAKKPGSKTQDSFVWIPAPYYKMGRNQ